MKKLVLVILFVISNILFIYNFIFANTALDNIAEDLDVYPYGCNMGSGYYQKIDKWKFLCITQCYCDGEEEKVIPGNLPEEECLEIATQTPGAVGANIGDNNCKIIIKKCKDFKTDTDRKGPYCSMSGHKPM